MKLIKEYETHILVQCNKCNREFDIPKISLSIIHEQYFSSDNCKCGQKVSYVDGNVDEKFKKSQLQIRKPKMQNVHKNEVQNKGCLIAIVGFVVSLIIIRFTGNLAIAILLIIVSFLIGSLMDSKNSRQIKKSTEIEAKIRASDLYIKARNKISIPSKTNILTLKKGDIRLLGSQQYVWIENNELCLFPKDAPNDDQPYYISSIRLEKIPIERIAYFRIVGEVFRENKITGGGGSGSSIGGAVVGGIIAGGVGAVIGSRKKINEIKSELITHDTRQLELKFLDSFDKEKLAYFDVNDLDFFENTMPHKNYTIVKQIKENEMIENATKYENHCNVDSKPIANMLRELSELKDEGIITEEEFSDKKKELLQKIN